MAQTLVSLSFENYDKCLEEMLSRLTGKVFNILTESGEKSLKYCGRQIGECILSKNGQVSIPLKPGGSVAWDLNVERVEIESRENGNIVLTRTFFKTGRKKVMTITQNPI